MALPYPIASSQTDANSPVDDNLMDSIRLDLDYLDMVLSTQGAIFSFNVNGPLRRLVNFKKPVDTVAMYNSFTPNKIRAVLKNSGLSGTLKVDIRKILKPKTPIIGIAHLFEASTQSIGNIAPALATQSVTLLTPAIATQSITYAKSAINITSIVSVGTNLWRYNLASAPDSDWTGSKVVFAGASAGGNNGTFDVVYINQSGYPSVVVSNSSGVTQTGAAGTAQVQIMSYNYINPVNSNGFVAGDLATFAAHTTGANNGSLAIYKINQGGNNIWIKNVGATQGAVAGNATGNVWVYTFTVAPSITDFIVGESIKASGHTNAANNGNYTIRFVKFSGANNLVVYNSSGATQGAGGTVNTNRWSYNLSISPAADISAGDTVQLESHTNTANNGIFTVKEVNRLSVNNIVIFNESGVVQGGVVGFVRTTKKLIQFSTDQSANYSTGSSYVEIFGALDGLYNYTEWREDLLVLAQNYGGGANFNLVVDVQNGSSQIDPAGYVMTEARSILTAPFTVDADVTADQSNHFIQGVTTSVDPTAISDGTPLGLYVLSIPDGDPRDLTVIMH